MDENKSALGILLDLLLWTPLEIFWTDVECWWTDVEIFFMKMRYHSIMKRRRRAILKNIIKAFKALDVATVSQNELTEMNDAFAEMKNDKDMLNDKVCVKRLKRLMPMMDDFNSRWQKMNNMQN